jgi:hypothetical protein
MATASLTAKQRATSRHLTLTPTLVVTNKLLVSDTLSGGASGVYDFSSGGADEGKHFIGFCLLKNDLVTDGSGFQIYFGNSSGHNGSWYVSSDDYVGGYRAQVIDPERDFDTAGTWTTNGNPAQLDDVSRMGFEFNVNGTIMGSFNNALADTFTVGFGLRAASNRITFDTSTDVASGTELITATSHGWASGTPVYYDNEGGSTNIGLTTGTIYYVNADGTNTVSIHATRADGIADTSPINLTSGTSETHSLTPAYDFEDLAVFDQDTNVYGWWTRVQGAFIGRGKARIGPATGNAESRFFGSAFAVIFADELVATGFYEIDMRGTDTLVDWELATISSAIPSNANNRWDLTLESTMGNTSGFGFNATNCVFQQLGTATLNANTTWTGCTLIDCNSVNLGDGTMVNCNILDPNVSTNTAFVTANDLTDLDECSFTSNTAGGHAVDIGTIASTQSMTWNCTDSGYAATDGSTGDETILVSVNTGITLTINVSAGASTPTIKNDGVGTVTVVVNPVTLLVKCIDVTDSSNIENVRVYVTAAAGGPLSEGTAIIDKTLTDVNGETSDTRAYASNQPITGVARQGTVANGTLYKESPITGTVNNSSGLNVTLSMIPDE